MAKTLNTPETTVTTPVTVTTETETMNPVTETTETMNPVNVTFDDLPKAEDIWRKRLSSNKEFDEQKLNKVFCEVRSFLNDFNGRASFEDEKAIEKVFPTSWSIAKSCLWRLGYEVEENTVASSGHLWWRKPEHTEVEIWVSTLAQKLAEK